MKPKRHDSPLTPTLALPHVGGRNLTPSPTRVRVRTATLFITFLSLFILSACAATATGTIPTAVATAAVISTPTLAPPTATATAVLPTIAPTDTPVFTLADTPTPDPTEPPLPFVEHIVQDGESLESIAQQYGTTIEAIAAASFLANPDFLYIGQTLTIPQATVGAESGLGQLPATAGQTAVIGNSVLGWAIEVYTFGSGPNTLIFVGGHHGGYEWNTTVLAYELIDYLQANPEVVPTAVTLHIIPAANPDGIYAVTGKTGRITASDVTISDTFPARFNARGVDLNRNWDCEWSATAFWRDQPVDPGTAPFSEVENQVLRNFISQQEQVKAVVFWHSQATLVSPGSCGEAHQPSIEAATVYARASNYPLQEFSAYEITGDASNWLAKEGIPSFSVELTTHETTDWERNRAGVLALLELYQE